MTSDVSHVGRVGEGVCACVSERLEKEREILEERAEKRVEILKNLVSRTVDLSAVNMESKKVMLTHSHTQNTHSYPHTQSCRC